MPAICSISVLLVLAVQVTDAKRVDVKKVADVLSSDSQVKHARSVELHTLLGKALPPGHEDELYCSPDHCLAQKKQQPGLVGPRSMHIECQHASDPGQPPEQPQAWGSLKPPEDRKKLLDAGYHQEQCQDKNSSSEDPPVPKENETDDFYCGALMTAFDACYPRAVDWLPGTWFDKDACTTQCTRKWGMCWCPNSGQSCSSVGTSDPGFYYDSEGGVEWGIRVNLKTREWEYLATEEKPDAEKGTMVRTWHWQLPSAIGKTFLAHFNNGLVNESSKPHSNIMKPNDAPDNFCDPSVMAQYMQEKKGVKW
jgi:hypothetical protein